MSHRLAAPLESIEVNNERHALEFVPITVPAHDRWAWSTIELREHKGKHKPIVTAWWDRDFSEGAPVKWQLFNRVLPVDQASDPYVTFRVRHSVDQPREFIDNQSGVSYVLDPWIIHASDSSAATFIDARCRDQYETGRVDVRITKETGSGNRNHTQPQGAVALRDGLSRDILTWLETYRGDQVERPRWWLDAFGLPVPWTQPWTPEPGKGRVYPDLRGFNEWYENRNEVNPYDVQHYDLDELYWQYRLTRDPSALFSMLNLWSHAERNAWYWRRDSNNLYAAIRTFGEMLTAGACILDCLRHTPGEPWQTLAHQVADHCRWHVDHGAKNWIWWDHTGSVPTEWKQIGFHVPWQVSRAVVGLDNYAHVAGHLKQEHDVGRTAQSLMKEMCAFLEETPELASEKVSYKVRADGVKDLDGYKPGTAVWVTAAMTRWETMTGNESPYARFLVDGMREWGWMNQAHKNHLDAVDVCPLEVEGFDESVFVGRGW